MLAFLYTTLQGMKKSERQVEACVFEKLDAEGVESVGRGEGTPLANRLRVP